jgi:predicted DsbA family dithiol-disulfide isomerase
VASAEEERRLRNTDDAEKRDADAEPAVRPQQLPPDCPRQQRQQHGVAVRYGHLRKPEAQTLRLAMESSK